MTFISIIIPFDTVKRYLKDCLDSLREQNIDDCEIILVLNGGKESVDDLLKEYDDLNIIIKSFDSRINVSKARNEGLKIAEGQYVYFIDSDDYIYQDGLSKLIDVAKNTNADFINGERINTGFIKERFAEEIDLLAEKKRYPLLKKNLADDEFSFKLLVGDKTDDFEVLSALHCLIKKNKMDKFFDESAVYQSDYEFMIDVLNGMESFVGVENAIYAKRIRDDPINLKSLNQQMGGDKFLIYSEKFKKAVENINIEALKDEFASKLFKYYYSNFSGNFYANPDKKWRNEYFDILVGLMAKIDFKNLSFYQKRELKSLKSHDKNKLRKLLKLRINFSKLLEMDNMWRIKAAIYYKNRLSFAVFGETTTLTVRNTSMNICMRIILMNLTMCGS